MRLFPRLVAEFLGTAGLLIVVVGSGIMGEKLAPGQAGLILLANSLATAAGLFALIQAFGSISGAHFNPVVTGVELLWKRLNVGDALAYVLAQVAGAGIGVLVTHAMFGLDLWQASTRTRADAGLWVSELIATFGLIMVISLSGRKDPRAAPAAISLYILAAYWATSSTSFANPAVTVARTLTETFTGISAASVPGFLAAQLGGGLAAYGLTAILSRGLPPGPRATVRALTRRR